MAKKSKAVIHGAGVKPETKPSMRPRSLTVLGEAKDYEAEFTCMVKPEDYVKDRTIPLTAAEGKKAPIVRGIFCTVDRKGKVQRHKVANTEGMKAFMESQHFKVSRLVESDPFALGFDLGANPSTGGLPPNNEYIPIMGGPFNKQQYIYDYLDMHAKCLGADTRIPLLDGTSPTIKELSQREGSYWVYSNHNGQVVPGRAFNARKTDIREVLEITLDNGKSFRCTADHPIMLRNGQFKDAGFLVPGESLMPLYRKSTRNYERVYHPSLDMWEQTHHMVMREANSEEFKATREMPNMAIDHKNEICTDNRPENLQVLTRGQNVSKAARTQKKRIQSSESMKKAWAEQGESMARKISKANKKRWASLSDAEREALKANLSKGQKRAWAEGKHKDRDLQAHGARMRELWADPEYKSRLQERMSDAARMSWAKRKGKPVNHKVASVTKLGYEEVYDLSVDKFHNFAIESGVFVHNCFESKNHNPLAKEIVDVITFFSMGKGCQVLFRSPELQAAWSIFEKRNKLGAFLRMDSDTITWAGELMTQKTKFADGYPKIVHIDPSTVWEVVTNPRDINEVFYYHQQFPTQYQLVYKAGDVSQEYVVNDIPADEVIHIKINTVPGEKRGRSDLFNILGWLKRFKDYYDARITKAQIEQSWALKKKVKGSSADVDAIFNDPSITAVPPPGSVLIENEAIDTEYMNPTTSSDSATDSIGEAIRSICATGAGLSPEYLGVGGKSGGNRATAITKSEPSARKFEDRQQLFEAYIREIVAYWMEACKDLPKTQVRQASLGSLKKALRMRDWKKVISEALGLTKLAEVTEPIDDSFEVIFPEIGTQDRSAKITDILRAKVAKVFSQQRMSTMIAKELGVTTYDYDEEMEQVREEAEEEAIDPAYNSGAPDPALAALGKGGPAAPGGGGPGSDASDKQYKDTQGGDKPTSGGK